MEGLVGVACEGEGGETRLAHGDAELLVQFADQRILRPFAVIQLAAGKLPQSGERLAFRPLRDQHAVVGVDQCAGDDEGELHDR